MALILLYAAFACALAAALLRPGWLRTRRGEVAFFAGLLVVVAASSWRIAFPQESVDFDTWLAMSAHKMRVEHASDMILRHRLFQNPLEYYAITAMHTVIPDLAVCRVALYVGLLLLAIVFMVRWRRTLFGTRSAALPALAALGMLLTTGGEYLVDSWNDHIPLLPLYVLGLVCVLRVRSAPLRYAVLAALVFLAESMLHSAEGWLWACALAVYLLPSRRGSRREAGMALAALVFMVLVGVGIVMAFPGGVGSATSYLGTIRHKYSGASVVSDFAEQFRRGGLFKAPPVCVVGYVVFMAGLLGVLAFRPPKLRWQLYSAWFAAACAYGPVYSPADVERYTMIAVVWPMVAALFLWRAQAMWRLRRRALLHHALLLRRWPRESSRGPQDVPACGCRPCRARL